MTPLTSQRGWLFSSLLRGLVLGGVLVAALLLFRGSGHGHARRGRGVGAKGRGGPKGAERHAAPARPEWRFKEYVPSEWESEWSAFVRSSEYTGKFNRHTAVACVKMTTEEPQRKKAREMLQLIKRRMPFVWSDFFDIDGNERDLSVTPHPDGKAPPPTPLESIWTSDTSPHPLLSKMVYSLPDGTQVAAYIEPLVGHLRHPMHCCKSAPWCGDPNNWDSRIGLIDTNYLLFDRRDGALGFETVKGEGEVQGPPKPIEGLYLDLGATLFPDPKQGREGWGSSQGFFPAMYSQLGLAFNSLSLWEVTRMDPGQIFQHVPADLIGGYQYFNVPVEAKEGRDWNAVEVLKGKLKAARDAYEKAAAIHGIRVERPAGQTGVSGSPLIYVVVKLDIDNSPIELALMKRLLELLPSANSTQSSDEPPFEIHELFFEHHTDVPDVIGPDIWCGGNCPSLAESYDLFTELRRRGVRSHSWI